MTLNKTFILISLILVSMLNVAIAATVYKWIDEDGQVHYGSRSDNKNAKEIEVKLKAIQSEHEELSPLLSAEERVKLKTKPLSAKEVKKKQRELKLIRCQASQDQLKRVEGSGKLYDLDEKGNRILLNKKQYKQAMQQAKARVEKWCN